MIENSLGIYIHIPFCIRKCPYCGFYSHAMGQGESRDKEGAFLDYKNQILKEIEEFLCEERTCRGKEEWPLKVDSIFFGGGTPSIFPAEHIEEILAAIKRGFDVTPDCEITLEANPGTLQDQLGEEKLHALHGMGITRLSIGVQSFDGEVLNTLGRIHTADEAVNTFRLARAAGFDNINLDLMFGVPGQSEKQWGDTLARAIELNPEHISFYSLQLEEDTPYFERFEKGELAELPEENDRAMYHYAIRRLKEEGYKHYEISNAAKVGLECRHNLKYWTGRDYIGFGDGASSYYQGARYNMMKGVKTDIHRNSRFDDMSEYTFTSLRLTAGLNYGEFYARFGEEFTRVFDHRWGELQEFFDSGALVTHVDAQGHPMRLVITEKGVDISNRIMAIFV